MTPAGTGTVLPSAPENSQGGSAGQIVLCTFARAWVRRVSPI